MSKPTYNDQILTGYLLGSLPGAEIESLDELSITDDEFVVALNVAEKELIDRYVQGELDDEELKRFETHFLASALRNNQIDFAKALQSFGQRTAATTTTEERRDSRVMTAAKADLSSEFGLFGLLRPALQWTFALAALVLLVAAGLLLFQNAGLRRQVNQTQAQRDELQQREAELQKQLENQRTARASTEQELTRVSEERARLEEQLRSGKSQPSGVTIASIILTPQMRDGGQIRTVTLSPDTERVAMQLQLEPNEYSTYIVALINQSGGQVLWRSGGIRAAETGARKSLSVRFRAHLLAAGTYRMQVSGIPPRGVPEVVSEYPFRVVK